MSIYDFNGLIQDWRRDRKRKSRRGTFAGDLRGYRQFVASVASQHLPRIREFITLEHIIRKDALRAWKQLVTELDDDMKMLDAFDPTGKTQFSAAILIAQGSLHDKEALRAFVQSKTEPVDSFGNPEFIGSIAASLDTIFDQTYHAMRGMIGKDLSRSLVRKASHRLHDALSQGLVGTLGKAKALLIPQLSVVEMELEKFLIGRLDSRK